MELVVMAAGMGKRFGGMKQLTSVGPNNELLIDYSIYDAKKSGLTKVIFVIKEEDQDLFEKTIGARLQGQIKVEYAYQKIDDLPIEIDFIKRQKPWETGQALLAARNHVTGPFIIINADDFYGFDAFNKLANYLKSHPQEEKFHYATVTYTLENTLSQNGTVSRGICEIENGYLKKVTERTKIGYVDNKLVYIDKETKHPIDNSSQVSVNLFGFTPSIFKYAKKYFIEFLTTTKNKETDEFYLPTIVQKMIDESLADVKILTTTEKFNGMTYKEDLEKLKQNIQKLITSGIYPENLWRK